MSGADAAAVNRPRPLDFDARVGMAAAATVLATAALMHFGSGPRGMIGATLCATLVALAVFDFDQRRIPNRIVLPATAVILVAELAFFPSESLEWVAATLGGGLVLAAPRLLKRDAIGFGDVKLGMLLGAGLGADVVTALLVGSVAVIPMAVWILVTRAEARGQMIPLGPFLALGGIAALFLGDLPT